MAVTLTWCEKCEAMVIEYYTHARAHNTIERTRRFDLRDLS